jgi:hypothetical protein
VNRATPKLREFAERLIVHETRGTKGATNNPAAFPAGEKLREPLATLMGMAGFRALLLRAITLASAEVPWLRAVQVRTDGLLEIAGELDIPVEKIAEGRVVLLAQLLGLLVAFIGEILTLRLVRETWPKLPPDDLDFN